ncbi:MAG: outer membrane beta-barrel protein [Bacteroidia bacterium]|nr:outer membrane beta-barrel protein [Bacteroidia bacterium]
MNVTSFTSTIRSASTLILLLILATAAIAQPEPPAPDSAKVVKTDTTEISLSRKKVIIITTEDGKKIEIVNRDEDEDVVVWTDSMDQTIVIGEGEDDGGEYEYDYDYTDKEERTSRKRSEVELLGLDLGFTNYYVNGTFGADAAIPELAVRSFRPAAHVALHLFPTRVSLIGRGAVNLKSAITIDWNHYYLTEDVTILDKQEQLTIDSIASGVNLSVNRLTGRYAQIPLLLNFNTDPGGDDGVSISVGGYAGILWAGNTKQKSEELGTIKIKDDFNLNPFRYGLTGRIDFKWFDFYLNYNLSQMFAENEGPETQTFTAGINFINF